MHPAYSVILFTTASGAGYGLLALAGLTGFTHGRASSFWFGVTVMVIGLALVSVGLLSSTFHLGRPERAWRAFSQWRSSWLSREGIVAVVTFVPAIAFAAAWTGFLDMPGLIAPSGVALAIMCVVTVFCTAKIYSSLPTIRQWRQPLTIPVYLAFALATGACLLQAIAELFGRGQLFLSVLATFSVVLVFILKLFYWSRIDTEERCHTIGEATGLGRLGGEVRQWEAPHTGANYIMKEMGYVIARRHAQKLRGIVMVLLVIAALACALAILTSLAAVIAAPLVLAAAVVERWLFFAEAQHVVNLYYGAERA
jgi:sulfite dehydrogenase (quinone) subunit SoeC